MEKEIEVKAKVDDFQNLLKKLTDLGCVFTEPATQDDTIFINYDRPFIEFKTGDSFLRIRKTNGKTIFTFKRGEEMNSIEREFTVSDAEQLKDTLVFLGFRPEVRVVKTRRKTKYKDYEICLDEVKGLGNFIEIEKITDEDAETAQNEMTDFLSSIGVESKDRVMNGYDTLTWLKDNPDYKKI
jgi:adenylate cyclase class 2